MLSTLKTLSIDNITLTQLHVNGVLAWELPSAYTNQVPLSIDTDGSIFNGCGYKDACRLSSGGVEKSSSDRRITGFIPCKAGDVIRFYYTNNALVWTDNEVASSFNFYDSSKTHLGQFTSQPADYGIFSGTTEYNNVQKTNNVWEYTVIDNPNIAFVRLTVPTHSEGLYPSGEKLIVTVNEEIV